MSPDEPLQPERQALADALRDMERYRYEDEYARALGLLARLTATGYRIVAVPGATAINRYREAEAHERSAGAAPPEPITDTSVLAIPDLTAEEAEAFDAAMAKPERSAGAAPPDVEVLAQAIANADELDDLDEDNEWFTTPRLLAQAIAAEYARLLDAAPSPSAEGGGK